MSEAIKNIEKALRFITAPAIGEISEPDYVRVAELTNGCIRQLETSMKALNMVLQRAIKETKGICTGHMDEEEYANSISLTLTEHTSLSTLQLQCLCTLQKLYTPRSVAAGSQRIAISLHRDFLSSLEKALDLKSEEK